MCHYGDPVLGLYSDSEPSADPISSFLWSGDQAIALMALWWATKYMSNVPFITFHIADCAHSLPATRIRLDGCHRSDRISPCTSVSVLVHWQGACKQETSTRHKIIVESSPALASHSPLGENWSWLIVSEWPCNVCTSYKWNGVWSEFVLAVCSSLPV